MADPPRGTRIAAYFRCSSDGQQFSIPGQRSVVDKIIETRGWNLVSTYEDEAESGATSGNRPGLQSLLNDAAANKFDLVAMYDVSRITRGGAAEFWMLVHTFKQCRVRLFCCARQQVANEETAILFTVDASQARSENVKRSKDAARGMHQSIFLRDQDPGRRPPYGYDSARVDIASGKEVERIRLLRDGSKQIMKPDASTVIRVIPRGEVYPKGASLRTVLVPGDPVDVAVVKRIFQESRFIGLKSLANNLNMDGLRSPTGKLWSCTSLREIVLNQAYLGRRVTNKVRRSRYHSYSKDGVFPKDETEEGRESFAKRPESEWNVWEGKHEPLIDEALFLEVQAARDRRQGDKTWNRKGRNQLREYLFSGDFMTCGRCGGGMNGATAAAKNYRYARYYCASNRRHGPSVCAWYIVKMDPLDEFAMREIRTRVTAPDLLPRIASDLEAALTRQLESHKPLDAGEVEALAVEQAEIERARRQIADTVRGNPAAIELMKPEIERLAAQAEALKKKLQNASFSLDLDAKKHRVDRGVNFYRERVLGPLEAFAQGETTMAEWATTTSERQGTDAGANPAAGRTHMAELKESLRLLGVRLVYDPDRKAGELSFDPFQPLRHWVNTTGQGGPWPVVLLGGAEERT